MPFSVMRENIVLHLSQKHNHKIRFLNSIQNDLWRYIREGIRVISQINGPATLARAKWHRYWHCLKGTINFSNMCNHKGDTWEYSQQDSCPFERTLSSDYREGNLTFYYQYSYLLERKVQLTKILQCIKQWVISLGVPIAIDMETSTVVTETSRDPLKK